METPGAKPGPPGLESVGPATGNLDLPTSTLGNSNPQMAPGQGWRRPYKMPSRPGACKAGLWAGAGLEVTSADHLFSDPPPGLWQSLRRLHWAPALCFSLPPNLIITTTRCDRLPLRPI